MLGQTGDMDMCSTITSLGIYGLDFISRRIVTLLSCNWFSVLLYLLTRSISILQFLCLHVADTLNFLNEYVNAQLFVYGCQANFIVFRLDWCLVKNNAGACVFSIIYLTVISADLLLMSHMFSQCAPAMYPDSINFLRIVTYFT
jgi:hypothetical protein